MKYQEWIDSYVCADCGHTMFEHSEDTEACKVNSCPCNGFISARQRRELQESEEKDDQQWRSQFQSSLDVLEEMFDEVSRP